MSVIGEPGNETGRRFWRAALPGCAVAVVVMSATGGALLDTGMGNTVEFLAGALIGALVLTAAAALVQLLFFAFYKLPRAALVVFGGALLALAFLRETGIPNVLRTVLDPPAWSLPFGMPHGLSAPGLFVVVIATGILAGVAALVPGGGLRLLSRNARLAVLSVTAASTVLAVAVTASLAIDGSDPYETPYRTLDGSGPEPLTDDPSLPGPYVVRVLTYGFGENLRRPEFGSARDLASRSIDAAPLLADWKDLKKRMRERYWGFGLDAAPLNGTIFTPDGAGPFPLVLIVHGNHGMEDYSDLGYAYLAELLASRGFIAVSVDQNYINATWSGDFGGKEMPLRAWLLLEHLRLWREWNREAGHPFFGKADMDAIALVGHSRGGEAVAIAHAFNSLPRYPDDATVVFDYGFNIRSLVAIAQIDQRYHRRVELGNVNFLALHGSYDSDEPAYHGMRQYNRIVLDGEHYRVKAGIYIHRANHGQFNTGWGREDASPPDSWLLNLAPIIAPEDQQQVAKAYISAFLEATLAGERRYLGLLADPRAGAGWLPDLAYVHQFTDSTFAAIADYEEDLDLGSGTLEGTAIAGDNLAVWREEELLHRDERRQGSSAAVLGWREDGATYDIRFDAGIAGMSLDAGTLLTFSVSGSTEVLPDEDDAVAAADDADEEPASPDFSIELEDAAGRVARLRVSDRGTLAPPLRVRYLKSRALNERRYNADWEPVLQTVDIPLAAFARANPELALSELTALRFRFDQGARGIIMLDNVGFRQPLAP